MQAVTSSTRRAFDDQRLRRSLATQSEVEAVVPREVSGRNINRAPVRALVQIESRKLDHARVATVETDVALLDGLVIDLEVDLNVVLWRIAEVADVDHEIVFILLSENDATRLDVCDCDVRWWIVSANVESRELCAVGEFESRSRLRPTRRLKIR